MGTLLSWVIQHVPKIGKCLSSVTKLLFKTLFCNFAIRYLLTNYLKFLATFVFEIQF